jgi:hypothetical protein
VVGWATLLSSTAGFAGSGFDSAGLACAGTVDFGGSFSGPRVPQADKNKDAPASSITLAKNLADGYMVAMLTRRRREEKWKKKNS